MIVGNKFSPRVHSTLIHINKSRFHPKRIENKTRKTIFFLCFMYGEALGLNVIFSCLVSCLVQVLNANKAYNVPKPIYKMGKKKIQLFVDYQSSRLFLSIFQFSSPNLYPSSQRGEKKGNCSISKHLCNSNTKRKGDDAKRIGLGFNH